MFSQWQKFDRREYDGKLPVHSFSGHGTSGMDVNYNNNYSGIYGRNKIPAIEQSGWINNQQYNFDSCNNMILRSRATGMQLPFVQHPIQSTLKPNPMLYGNTSDHVQNCYISPIPSPGLKEVVSTYSSQEPNMFFSLPETSTKLRPRNGIKCLKPIAAKLLAFLVFCAVLAYFYFIKDSFRRNEDKIAVPDGNELDIKIIYSENDDEETVVEAMHS